jgi:hypothetical protein
VGAHSDRWGSDRPVRHLVCRGGFTGRVVVGAKWSILFVSVLGRSNCSFEINASREAHILLDLKRSL